MGQSINAQRSRAKSKLLVLRMERRGSALQERERKQFVALMNDRQIKGSPILPAIREAFLLSTPAQHMWLE